MESTYIQIPSIDWGGGRGTTESPSCSSMGSKTIHYETSAQFFPSTATEPTNQHQDVYKHLLVNVAGLLHTHFCRNQPSRAHIKWQPICMSIRHYDQRPRHPPPAPPTPVTLTVLLTSLTRLPKELPSWQLLHVISWQLPDMSFAAG